MTRRLGSVIAVLLLTAPAASAQGFISGFLGTAFSKPILDACSVSAGCQDGQRTWGFAAGGLGSVFGVEFDLGSTKAFFGETGTASSGLTTMMGNVMLAPRIGFVQPYGLAGVGLMRMNVDSLSSAFLQADESKLAWDLGAGVFVFFGRNLGIRGDIRQFRGMGDLEVATFTIPGSDLRFNRAAASVVLRF